MPLPSQLGRLRQVERVGAGGFATVWRFHDAELDSDVAVKALADNWSDRLDIRDRFLEEARILRRADSDHVVRVHDIGETASGTPYFVMTYADRGTVGDLIVEGGLPLSQVADLIGQAAEGLTVLHRNGIIHRDIKPQNLLLHARNDGSLQLLVADLGVAKAAAQASGLTQLVGTPAYIAPEQAHGQGVDVRADVHALAAVAYVLLTGRLVREDGLAGLLRAQLPPAPSTYAPDLTDAVDQVVLRGLAIDPADRWPDAASFAEALRKVDAGETVILPRLATAVAEPARPRLGARVIIGVLLVLVASFVIAFWVTSSLI